MSDGDEAERDIVTLQGPPAGTQSCTMQTFVHEDYPLLHLQPMKLTEERDNVVKPSQ